MSVGIGRGVVIASSFSSSFSAVRTAIKKGVKFHVHPDPSYYS